MVVLGVKLVIMKCDALSDVGEDTISAANQVSACIRSDRPKAAKIIFAALGRSLRIQAGLCAC